MKTQEEFAEIRRRYRLSPYDYLQDERHGDVELCAMERSSPRNPKCYPFDCLGYAHDVTCGEASPMTLQGFLCNCGFDLGFVRSKELIETPTGNWFRFDGQDRVWPVSVPMGFRFSTYDGAFLWPGSDGWYLSSLLRLGFDLELTTKDVADLVNLAPAGLFNDHQNEEGIIREYMDDGWPEADVARFDKMIQRAGHELTNEEAWAALSYSIVGMSGYWIDAIRAKVNGRFLVECGYSLNHAELILRN